MSKELPKNWTETDLFSISSVGTGKKDANFASENGIYNFFTCAFKPLRSDSYSYEGDVLILPGNGVNVGEVFYYSGKFEAYQRTYIVSDIMIEPKYLFYHFLRFWKEIGSSQQFGSATNYIKIGNFKNYTVQIPPLAEQERIVAKLDDLFSRLDKIKTSLENLKELRRKFVYSSLIRPVDKKFFDRKKIGGFLEEGTKRIGEDWNSCRKIGVSAKKGIIDLSTGQKKTFEKYKIVRPGDFIYNTMRVNIGSIAIYRGKEIAITSPDYVVFRVKSYISSELLLRFLKSDQGLLEIGANTKGSVRARLYFKSLAEVRIPLSEEHTQILAEKFLTTFSKSIKKLNKLSQTHLEQLSQAILHKAFKGELVPQLESDGDARDLLSEIEELKKSAGSKPKKGKTKKYKIKKEELLEAAEGKANYKTQ